jgi:tetratricopeptide (TPR) repeat protein
MEAIAMTIKSKKSLYLACFLIPVAALIAIYHSDTSDKPERNGTQKAIMTELKSAARESSSTSTPPERSSPSKEEFDAVYADALEAAENDNWPEVERLTRLLVDGRHYDSTPFSAMASVQLDYYNRPELAVEWCLKGLLEFPNDVTLSDLALETINKHGVDLKQLDPSTLSQLTGQGEQQRFLATLAEMSGDYKEAVKRKSQYIAQRKTNVHQDLRDLGRIYLKQGEIDLAMRYYRISRDHRSIYPDQVTNLDEQRMFAVEYLGLIEKYGSQDEKKLFLDQLAQNPMNNEVLSALRTQGKT